MLRKWGLFFYILAARGGFYTTIFSEDLSDLNLDNIPKDKLGFSKASKSISTTKPSAGFTTAEGKTVSVSSAALNHIKASQLPELKSNLTDYAESSNIFVRIGNP